jgi:integrase
MGLWKRRDWYWADFTIDGVRYRVPLHTKDEREAKRKEKDSIAEAKTGKLTQSGRAFAHLAFSAAIERYTASRRPRLARRTIQTERERTKPLVAYFRATTLQTITTDDVLGYIADRKQAGISNATINRERDLLRGVLVKARRWHTLNTEELRPLKVESHVGKALQFEEKLRLLKIAASRPEWQIVRLAAMLALNTTMRACELKGLRWREVDLIERKLTVRRSKTKAGERVIPLNPDAWEAIRELRERAKILFGDELQPDWYVFPHAEGYTKPDPTKPMSGWRTAWRRLTRDAGLPGLRFHDLRHHAITELAEGRASDQVIRSIAGHVSKGMLEHYSHIRLDAKRTALEALSGRGSEGSYVTKHVTNLVSEQPADPQVVEGTGGRHGIRTHGLLVANEALSQLS